MRLLLEAFEVGLFVAAGALRANAGRVGRLLDCPRGRDTTTTAALPGDGVHLTHGRCRGTGIAMWCNERAHLASAEPTMRFRVATTCGSAGPD